MLRWLTGGKEDFAQVLQDIENDMQRTEEDMASCEASSNTLRSALLKYLGALYGVFLAAYFTVLNPADDPLSIWMGKVAVLALFPVGIYYSRKLVDVWYKAKLRSSSRRLETLRATQKVKIEELKKMTGYYTTKNLIDKFDTPPKSTLKSNSPKKNQPMQQLPGNNPTPMQTPIRVNQNSQMNAPTLPHPNAAMQIPNVNGLSGIPATPINSTPVMRGGVAGTTPSSTWFDRVMDAVVGGEEGPQNKYALICKSCFEHNGLVPPEQYDGIKFKCMACGYLNTSMGSRNASRSSSVDMTPGVRTRASFDENASLLSDRPNEQPFNTDATNAARPPVFEGSVFSDETGCDPTLAFGHESTAVVEGDELSLGAEAGASHQHRGNTAAWISSNMPAASYLAEEDVVEEVQPFEVQQEVVWEKESQSASPSKESSDYALKERN
ncbi:hypothetical protein CcCBS67573_g01388 [Chytriomyces confervae]|uniref:Endoplasmic reticulum junction formation protein lunapark n=1 Tax=Chytriomyces confervae TaxID=246404 RepID=A0A507FM55_9FUNG|nr:hypothetical protein HDU80_004399 [Chytriomyces hyalinus]TPX77342.1 hypothetical protein CcCBS67573_g01388 [Chytriomyces confervae]